ncbi:acetyl-CoA C-acetyltransferase [Dyadobacter sp. BE34]|uniref:acetyl-CoA C-acetyltransferase n=1 Tax=Dyadobacter fermentans TaxID=94254 RepID=A0ABU1R2G0_9BACT|nr:MULTISPECIES: acetyl-CoA C-acyltransferase [Dyadobacter]MDR6807422.1 acetyl-CoA C-acetyltransferase [Dyadobacter fermentans]MDR7045163.1 acetyl-CoA C-acetyltransferase [Dyadobacter sp. BE242]MDR7199100.1 acetyl-CoA C-acetyltransferase [Dyadobacter sp. BE34]MDR7217060.1 acetyl-CoA C-acetyltransferase [Dyadobacter sp. BE31]MDR7264993.1 acetyl-CoA C-acetyltransferase [Dyadobacter sp. BE32]
MQTDTFILSASRTPIGSFGGALSPVHAAKLGATAIQGALAKSGVEPGSVDEVLMGNVVSANLGQAPARQAAIYAGLPVSVICTTVNKVCASGMKATALGAQAIQLGDASIVVAGGMENMSQIPYYLPKGRNGYGYGHGEIIDGLLKDGLTDVYDQIGMGVCGDKTALKYNISREAQDEFAIRSYQRSAEATANGSFADEIVPVEILSAKGEANIVSEDEEYKRVKFDKIPTLKPVFSKDGTVTAANASTINDGGAALVLAGSIAVNAQNLKPIARIVAYADAEQEPAWFTTTPVLATEKVLKKAGLKISDIDYFEVNEAFAVVVLAYIQALNLDIENVNVFGGAVSLGHPLGASGARIITTLLSVLTKNNGKYGLAAICNGGGGASAMIVERL